MSVASALYQPWGPLRDSRGFYCRRAAAGADHCLHFRQSRCGTAIARYHQRPAQAAALRNLPLRSIPSLVPAFIPGLSDICRSPRRFTQCLRATHSHGHGRPWVSRGHSLRLPRCCPPHALPRAAPRLRPAARPAPGRSGESCSKSFWD